MGGKYHYEINDFSQIHGQLLVPLEILMSKIYLKYIPIHIRAHQRDYEHEIIQQWLPVSQKYK